MDGMLPQALCRLTFVKVVGAPDIAGVSLLCNNTLSKVSVVRRLSTGTFVSVNGGTVVAEVEHRFPKCTFVNLLLKSHK